ncbi:MAG: RecX family transcriptional regulator [Synergistaceae bacterium]|nr:RecX family transcriptional regulator [Synergistaceae bacterium]
MNENVREKFFSALLRRPGTRKQAREMLKREKLSAEEREALMLEAEDAGLIDDEAFARLFVDGHLQWGNLKIAYELGMRGVQMEEIENALDDAEEEPERAQELAESWRKSGLEEKKIISRLLSRGFTNRSVRSITR